MKSSEAPGGVVAGPVDSGEALLFVSEPLREKIVALLTAASGVNFVSYKWDRLARRIVKYFEVRGGGWDSWFAYLETHPDELAELAARLLVRPSRFFHEPEAFEVFCDSVIPALLDTWTARSRAARKPLRVWIPGCSTGQEAYSIAICIAAAITKSGLPVDAQIFATDIDEGAIAVARAGMYSAAEVASLSPERRRFFSTDFAGFRIAPQIRKMLVFARNDLLVDPPFSHLDLIACRDGLSRLRNAVRQRVVNTFHYALEPGGRLWLSHLDASWTPDVRLFDRPDGQPCFYRKGPCLTKKKLEHGPASLPPDTPELAWLLVDANLDLIGTSGDLGPWIELSGASKPANLLRAARPEYRADLARLFENLKTADYASASLIPPTGAAETRIDARRMKTRMPDGPGVPGADFFAVAFVSAADALPALLVARKLEYVRMELTRAADQMKSVVRARDELYARVSDFVERSHPRGGCLGIVPALLSAHHTPRFREEWRAGEEVLNTVNEELQLRNRDLVRLSNHLASLLSSTTIPILMVDKNLCIRRVTPSAEGLFGIRQADVGRPISSMPLGRRNEDLVPLVRRVIERLAGEELELLDGAGRWHLLQVRPYRTTDDRIEGAVLAMIDIDQIQRARNLANAAREFSESLIESIQTPLLVLNRELRVLIANRMFLMVYGLRLHEIQNRSLQTLGSNQWDLPALHATLGRVACGESLSEDIELEQELAGNLPGLKRIVLVNVRRVVRADVTTPGSLDVPREPDPSTGFHILLAAADVTAQRRAEKIMLEERERLRRSVLESQEVLGRNREELRALAASLLSAQDDERRRLSRELHDDVSQNVAKLQFDIEMLEQKLPPSLAGEKGSLVRIAESVGQLSDDLRRLAYGLHPSTLDHLGLAVALRAFCREFARRTRIRVRFTSGRLPSRFPPDIANSLYRITQEALRNVARHASACEASVRLTASGSVVSLTIRDNGPGFDRDSVRSKGGLGLISMRERARLIHASFDLVTEPGAGATITVTVQLGGETAENT